MMTGVEVKRANCQQPPANNKEAEQLWTRWMMDNLTPKQQDTAESRKQEAESRKLQWVEREQRSVTQARGGSAAARAETALENNASGTPPRDAQGPLKSHSHRSFCPAPLQTWSGTRNWRRSAREPTE